MAESKEVRDAASTFSADLTNLESNGTVEKTKTTFQLRHVKFFGELKWIKVKTSDNVVKYKDFLEAGEYSLYDSVTK